MKRIALLPITTVDGARVPTLPAAVSGWVMLHDWGARALVKLVQADGTAKTTTTIADITVETTEDGGQRQVEVTAESLTTTQRNAAKTFLTGQGFNTAGFDAANITNRAELLTYVLEGLRGWMPTPVRKLLDGWDVA